MNELECGICGDPFDLHCGFDSCQWLLCRTCQLIISQHAIIPTWERYVAEGREDA